MRATILLSLFSLVAAVALVTESAAQAPDKSDTTRAELEALRAQVKALQAQVDALQSRLQKLESGANGPYGPFGLHTPAATPPDDDGDPAITTGVNVLCRLQLLPGVQGARIPPPVPYEGATIRVREIKGNKVLREGETTKTGRVRLEVPPGKYHLEIVTRSPAETVQSPIEISVSKDKLTKSETTITIAAP